MTDRVLSFFKEVDGMTPYEVIDHLAYLRRTVSKREAERASADLSQLPVKARRALAKVAKSDREMLIALDEVEASIHAQFSN